MLKSTYLSIDCDYFESLSLFKKYLDQIIELKVPIVCAYEHDEILYDINRSGATRIINIDHHSDLSDYSNDGDGPLSLNEGTWANFIENKKDKHFIWIYPQDGCRCDEGTGRCDGGRDPFRRNCIKVCGWGRTTARKKLPSKKELQDVGHVGLSLSLAWSSGSIARYAYERSCAINARFTRRLVRAKRNGKLKVIIDNGKRISL